MKFLFITDTHVKASNPSSRKDDFPKTIIRKLKWVGEKANELQVDAVLHGGDWLDRPDISNTTLYDLVRTLIDWNKPIYTVLGNHDIYGYNPDTFKRTALGLLESAGVITRLSKTPIEIGGVSLTGIDSHFNLDKGCLSDYVCVPGDISKVKIHIVHGFLTKAKWPQVPCTIIEDILDTEADILLSGHEHGGYGIIDTGKKIFCNPGALARVTAGVGDVNKEVRMALITVENGNFDIQYVNLPDDIALSSNIVLDRDKLMKEKEIQYQLSSFSENIQKFNINSNVDFDIYALLEEMIRANKIKNTVADIIRDRLGKAEESLKKEEE